MKICNKCGYENPNSVSVCEKCYNVLNEISEGKSEKFFKKLERKEKIINTINYLLLIFYFIIVVPLFFLSAKAMGSFSGVIVIFFLLLVIIPVVFYISIFHPDELFKLSYRNVISNISDAQPSDLYYITTTCTAYFFLGFGIYIVLKLYFGVA